MKSRPLRKCDECGKNSLRRLIGSGAGVIFKGSGFYETDYRSKSYKEAEKKEKGKPEKDKGRDKDKTSDIKSESKSTSKDKEKSKKKKD